MKFHYRITKYNPEYRDENGHYLRNELTFYAQVGKTFGNALFTEQEYRKIEDAYVSSALAFLSEAGIRKLSLTYIENPQSFQSAKVELRKDNTCEINDLEDLFRAVLREEFWCKFQWRNHAYVHFGWDYYMYIGLQRECLQSINYAESQGLFVEPFISPYWRGK